MAAKKQYAINPVAAHTILASLGSSNTRGPVPNNISSIITPLTAEVFELNLLLQ